MRRIINYRTIGETASYILLQKTLLEDLKDKLDKNILTITDGFKGIDAEKIKLKYELKIKLVEDYLLVISDYQRYFEWLAGKYRDSDEKVARDLMAIKPNTDLIVDGSLVDDIVTDEEEPIDIIGFAKKEGLGDIWKI